MAFLSPSNLYVELLKHTCYRLEWFRTLPNIFLKTLKNKDFCVLIVWKFIWLFKDVC